MVNYFKKEILLLVSEKWYTANTPSTLSKRGVISILKESKNSWIEGDSVNIIDMCKLLLIQHSDFYEKILEDEYQKELTLNIKNKLNEVSHKLLHNDDYLTQSIYKYFEKGEIKTFLGKLDKKKVYFDFWSIVNLCFSDKKLLVYIQTFASHAHHCMALGAEFKPSGEIIAKLRELFEADKKLYQTPDSVDDGLGKFMNNMMKFGNSSFKDYMIKNK